MAALAPGLAGFVLGLDDFGHQAEGLGVQAAQGRAGQGFPAQQQRFAQAQMVDAAGGMARGQPGEIAGIAPGDDLQFHGEASLQGGGQRRQFGHVARIGGDAVLAAEVGADPQQPQGGLLQGELGHGLQIGRQDSLAQIPQFHHQQHPMAATLAPGCRRQGLQHHRFAVATAAGMGHHPLHLAEHGRADQQHRRGDAGGDQGLDRFDAGVADRVDPGRRPGAHDLRQAEAGLAHRRHADAAAGQLLAQAAGVVKQAIETDLQPGAPQPAAARAGARTGTRAGARAGKARSTICTRRSGGRLRASVTGRPSSAS